MACVVGSFGFGYTALCLWVEEIEVEWAALYGSFCGGNAETG